MILGPKKRKKRKETGHLRPSDHGLLRAVRRRSGMLVKGIVTFLDTTTHHSRLTLKWPVQRLEALDQLESQTGSVANRDLNS